MFYFNETNQNHIPDTFDYPEIVYYKSPIQTISCKGSHGRFVFPSANAPMAVKNVTPVHVDRVKRDSAGLGSFHSAQNIPRDGIYYMIIKVSL